MELFVNHAFQRQQTVTIRQLDHVAGHVMRTIMPLEINVSPTHKIVE